MIPLYDDVIVVRNINYIGPIELNPIGAREPGGGGQGGNPPPPTFRLNGMDMPVPLP